MDPFLFHFWSHFLTTLFSKSPLNDYQIYKTDQKRVPKKGSKKGSKNGSGMTHFDPLFGPLFHHLDGPIRHFGSRRGPKSVQNDLFLTHFLDPFLDHLFFMKSSFFPSLRDTKNGQKVTQKRGPKSDQKWVKNDLF